MKPFKQSENGYTATAKTVAFPALQTATTAGSSNIILNVLSTTGFTPGDQIVIGSDNEGLEAVIQSMTSTTMTLQSPLAIVVSSGVTVAKGYPYDVTRLDNPVRAKANYGLASANLRNYKEFRCI